MNGKELLFEALKGNQTPRPAWVPFVGVHGGKMQGVDAEQYLKSSELILEGLRKSKTMYKPDGLPIVFDLQIEAEVLGCDLRWAKDAPPAVCSHPLMSKELDDLPAFDTNAGRFPMIKDVLTQAKAEMGEDTALYGLITGPFTLALHLMGNDIFLDMYDEEDEVKAVIQYCADVAIKTAMFYLDNGADVIAIVDPMTSQISPAHFEEFVTPYVNQVFDAVHERGAFGSMFVCGDATRNLEAMVDTNCDNVSIDENISLESLRDLAVAKDKSFGGNLKLTVVLLMGDVDDSKLDALRCIDVGGCKGFVLAPGCDLPFDTPVANLVAVAEMVHDEYSRDVARTTLKAKEADSFDDIKLPDFATEDKVIIDIITLDSTSCAPCQYMVEAVEKAVAQIDAEVVVNEHKIKTREGVGYMCQLGVQNLPTICIDGEVKFISVIPDQPTLISAIEEKVKAKA